MKRLLFLLTVAVSLNRATAQPLRDHLSEHHIVFVTFSDFLTWLRPFEDNAKAILKYSPATKVSFLPARFFHSYELNAQTLYRGFIQKFNEGGRRPLIIIGNPQSGPDSLYTVLRNPDLIKLKVVSKLVLIAPAFGSPLALSHMPMMSKFKVSVARKLFKEALREFPAAETSRLNQSVFYVRAASVQSQVTPFLKIPFTVLKSGGPNDGVTYTRDQKLPYLGIDLGVVDADHWDLFASQPASNSSPVFRYNWTLWLLKTIFHPHA
jgi:hypothetical protein